MKIIHNPCPACFNAFLFDRGVEQGEIVHSFGKVCCTSCSFLETEEAWQKRQEAEYQEHLEAQAEAQAEPKLTDDEYALIEEASKTGGFH
jgi:hypothetical protein